MNDLARLNSIREQLAALQSGQTLRIHEMHLAQAFAEGRSIPNHADRFFVWCQGNGIASHKPMTSDYFVFSRV